MRKEISDQQRARLAHLASLPDDTIDTTDIPEVADWRGAVRGAPLPQREPGASPGSQRRGGYRQHTR